MSTLRARILSFSPLAGFLLVGGCGFTPLYATPGVTPKLASIEVVRPDGRTGYLLGQYLEDDLAKNRGEAPIYRLTLATHETRVPRGIRVDNVASRYEVDLNTVYTLTEIATKKVITAGKVAVNVTYDSADQPYAGIAAEQDGQDRAAQQAADRIRIDLASFFASPRPTPAAATLTTVDIATYSERLQAGAVQSPREKALGQPTPQSGAADIFGQTLRTTTSPSDPAPPAFNAPSQPASDTPPDVQKKDPTAIQTLPGGD
jgi:LPS-assembly lipoprotein